MRINHGGVFTKFPGRRYIHGKTSFVDLIDTDMLSVHEIDAMMLELGYQADEKMYYHFLTPGSDMDFGLEALGNDSDVLKLMKFVPKVKFVDVFIEHWKTLVDTYNSPPHARKMEIQELDEPGNQYVSKKKLVKKTCKKKLFLEWIDNKGEASNIDKERVVDKNRGFDLNKQVDMDRPLDVSDMLYEQGNDEDMPFDLNLLFNEPEVNGIDKGKGVEKGDAIDKGKGVDPFEVFDEFDPYFVMDCLSQPEMAKGSDMQPDMGSGIHVECSGIQADSEGDDDSVDEDYVDDENRIEEDDIDMDDFVDGNVEWIGGVDKTVEDSEADMDDYAQVLNSDHI